jgi:hypothetical protein
LTVAAAGGAVDAHRPEAWAGFGRAVVHRRPPDAVWAKVL